MAFFKFPWPGRKDQGETAKPARRSRSNAQAESIDAMRRRARHRLIGAAVLVLIGIVGFPLVFDTQPRPIPVDIPIDVPDRNRVAPLVVPDAASGAQAAAQPPVTPAAPPPAAASSTPAPSAVAGLDAGEEVISTKPAVRASAPVVPLPPLPKVESHAQAPATAKPAEPRPEPRQEPKVEHKPAAPESRPAPRSSEDAARARALLEGRDASATASTAAAPKADEGKLIVQVGAFADADKAREIRSKLERAGLKTYTQVVDTKDGKRTRVRVGPYASRADADKAAARIKGLGLPASVLTL